MTNKTNMLDLKLRFNDAVMRELGLDIENNNYLYDMDTESILQNKGKYIKYCEEEFPMLSYNEIELNLIENPNLTETLSVPFFTKYCERNNVSIHSITQYTIPGSYKGYFVLSYLDNGVIKEMKSDCFINESLRVFNLICKINKTQHLYRFDDFDIQIIRKR